MNFADKVKELEKVEDREVFLKEIYLRGARDVFGVAPTDQNGWLTFISKSAMVVTSRDPDIQEEQLLAMLKRVLGV